MDISDVQLVGGPCGQHGPYTFYKAFRYTKNSAKKIITLSEFFFVKMWRDSDLLCIGELQLLWTDKNSEQTLASLRLYFLPENTPEGRMDHGEDEVLAISEKVVIRLDDLIAWIIVKAEWTWGRLAKCEDELKEVTVDKEELAFPRKPAGNSFAPSETVLDFSDVEQDREKLEACPEDDTRPHVIILSFSKYCRYRAMMKRLEGVENQYLKYKIVNALGGFYVKYPNTRVLFCRDTFDYPELEGHELLCNHLAPKLKGRPRGKRKKRSVSPGSESNESESSISNHYTRFVERANGTRSESPVATRRSTRCHENNENKQFMKTLGAFMKAKHISMGRVPSLGYKELNLHEFYTKVQKLGGYDNVTTNRLWKSIFDDMTGNLNSTSAATIIRRHYERFLLAYERNVKGEEYKPLPVSERRRLKSKQGSVASSRTSDSESSNDTPPPSVSRPSSTPPVSSETKEASPTGKTSSLRSVRVKPERQKDRQTSLSDKVSLNNLEQTIKTEPDEVKSESASSEKDELAVDKKEEDNDEEIPKEEAKEDSMSPKTEPNEINPSVPEGTKTETSIPDKEPEPVTNAVAPVAVSTVIPDKVLSPLEGKENIPVIKTGDVATTNATPEVAKSDSYIHDVKRIKLDILKEGGLEVTPVRPGLAAPTLKDIRPSVIQQPAKPIMPPPPLVSSTLPKRNLVSSYTPSINITQSKAPPGTPSKQNKSGTFHQFVNGVAPPKVVQSRSIYSYSEKTVYGNPKDVIQQPQAPKFVETAMRAVGGDPMDLSVTSPQKPAVEIMRIPQSSGSGSSATPYNRDAVTRTLYKTSAAPVIDGRRLGSNLEITLVGTKPSKPPSSASHKRAGGETYAQKIAKLKAEENGSRHHKYHHIPSGHKASGDKAFAGANKSHHHRVPTATSVVPPSVPHQYRFPAPEASNGVNPFLPLMDNLYYQVALQNAYSNMPPPMLPLPTAEQLKFYAELVAHGRLNFPLFPHTNDGALPTNNATKKQ